MPSDGNNILLLSQCYSLLLIYFDITKWCYSGHAIDQ